MPRPRTDPEDYCLRPRSEGAIGATPALATLTGAGRKVFDYLNPAIRFPSRGPMPTARASPQAAMRSRCSR